MDVHVVGAGSQADRDQSAVALGQQHSEGVAIRRDMALPVMTFSPMAYLLNDSIVPGAVIGTRPAATSSSEIRPLWNLTLQQAEKDTLTQILQDC